MQVITLQTIFDRKIQQKNQYLKLDQLGEGTYGIVHKVQDLSTKEIFALKRVKLDFDEGIPSTTLREIALLQELKDHPNIVQLKKVDYNYEEKRLDLILEYMPYDLKKLMQKNSQQYTDFQIQHYIYQMLQGLDYCHSRRIFHRDIKPQNILIDPSRELLKIADFGLARAFGVPIKTFTHEVETLWYRAPEILMGMKQYSLGVDMWSIGCIFYELMERRVLFNGDSEIDQIFRIFKFNGTPTAENNIWPQILEEPLYKRTFPRYKTAHSEILLECMDQLSKDLILQMLNMNPEQRITVKEALKHEYFDSLPNLIKETYEPFQ